MREYNPNNLKALMERSNLSIDRVAKATNLSVGTIRNCLASITPTLGTLTALADYFAVPLDFITGRCDEETSRGVLKDYSRHFMELRRAPFEAYLVGRNPEYGPTVSNTKMENPWPYNLLDAVLGQSYTLSGAPRTIVDRVSDDDIMATLDTLNPREKLGILSYFRDGMTLKEIGELPEFNVRSERVRQIITRAVYLLRHPSRAKVLRYGSELAKRESEIERKKRELNEAKCRLEDRERKLEAWRIRLKRGAKELTGRCEDEETAKQLADNLEDTALLRIPLDDLELDTRAYNCLSRADLKNLGDVVGLVESGKMLMVRNLGHYCARQILDKVNELTGKDYRCLYPKI